MIFHENHLLAGDSHIIPYFFRKLDKMSQNLSSAAVVIEAFRVKSCLFDENRELSGRVLDSRPRGGGLESYWPH